MADDANGSAIIEAARRSPFSAATMIAFFFLGGMAWWQTQSDLSALKEANREIAEKVRSNEKKADDKMDSLTRDMSDIKVATRGIQTSVEFLVRQIRIGNGNGTSSQ